MAVQIERWVVAFVASGTAGVTAYVALRGLRTWPVVAGLAAILVVAAGGLWLAKRLPDSLDGIRRRRPWLSAGWLLVAVVGLGLTVRQAAFMVDASAAEHSLLPYDDWTVAHCCLTAYAEGARFARDGETNIYQPGLYKPSGQDRRLAGFTVDSYHYPPPFLLLPLAAQTAVGGGFLEVRALWFGLTALTLLLAIGLLAYRFEGQARLRVIATAPVLWCSMPIQLGLQMSNFQILVVATSVLAFVAFQRRAVVGGALLAFSAVSKIFPGILGVYLLARRRWRDAAWTVGFAVAFSLVALAVVGPAPFRAFVEFEMPRLSSGEAFSVPLSRPSPLARNMAPFGIPMKAARAGVGELGLPAGRTVSIAYAAMVVALALWSARRRPESPDGEAVVWLALLSLGTLVSPFAPAGYVLSSLVWLVCLDRDVGKPAVVATVWLATSLPLLIDRDVAYMPQMLAFVPAQVLALVVPALVLYRAGASPRKRATAIEPRPALA